MDDNIKLNAGKLSSDQVNELLASLPGQLAFFDENGYFEYYKQPLDMNYQPPEIGKKIDELDLENTSTAFKQIKNHGAKEVHYPAKNNSLHRFYVDTYRQAVDKDGNFAGMTRQIQDIYPLVEYYLKQTGQKLVDDPENSQDQLFHKQDEIDSLTGASEFE